MPNILRNSEFPKLEGAQESAIHHHLAKKYIVALKQE